MKDMCGPLKSIVSLNIEPRPPNRHFAAQVPKLPVNSAKLSGMDLTKMISHLRTEREQVEAASVAIERLARGMGKRRGRPPKEPAATPKGQARKGMSSAARKAQSERMKMYWAQRRKHQARDA